MARERKGGPGHSKSRPSSSSLAAAHPGAAPLGFGGYMGSSLVETTFSAEREVSQNLDGEATLQLKRLSKRDPTTKVFEYKRLVQDKNLQVRENTHGTIADDECQGEG